MSIQNLIEEYTSLNQSGILELNKDENINNIVAQNNVPNSYGIYIIYSIKDSVKEIIYIGKSGTMVNNGTFKQQGIRKRLGRKQNNKPRHIYFQDIIKEYKFEKLEFLWITTFDEMHHEIPSLSEAKMLQAYFNQYKKLPLLNKEA